MDILSIVLSPILFALTTFIVLFLTQRFESKSKAKETKMARIEKLYVPFYTYCLIMFYPENDNSIVSKEISAKFLDLFMKNISYMSTDSQKHFKKFYLACLKNQHSKSDELNLKNAFNNIGKSLTQDYQSLCKELKLEEPIELF